MKNKSIALLIILINALVVYLCTIKISSLPPFGKFFSPFHGYLNLTNSDQLPKNDLYVENINDTISVVWDELRIPHIFANNEATNGPYSWRFRPQRGKNAKCI